jgi:shikimate kinase
LIVGAPGSARQSWNTARRTARGRVPHPTPSSSSGRKIDADIFADDGEATFRALEQQITTELLPLTGVLSLGGGSVLSANTRAALRDHRVVWLRVGLAQAVKRVGLDTARPLLLGNVRGQLLKLLNERAELYGEVATDVIDTDHTAPAEIVEMIMNAHVVQD